MPDSLTRRALLAAAAGPLCARAAAPRKPNIILILADDLGYGDLGCYGHRSNRTPNLDRLAAGGIRFTDFHSNGAVCSPTRAALLTGRYQQRSGVTEVITAVAHRDHGLSPDEPSFARQMKLAGYRTAIFGKWHLGYQPRFNPDKHGFDEFRGYVSGNVDYFSHIDLAGEADWWHNSKLEPEEGYVTDLITRHGVRFIEENRSRPFCLYLAHEAVHSPYQGPNDKPMRKIGNGKTGRPPDVPRTYGEMLESMDAGIGRVMDAVKRAGLERDTFVFFFSDNGATREGSNGRLRGFKSQLWEGGHREPAIAYWPGRIRPGQISNATAIGMDLLPTMAALGGAPLPEKKPDGINLLPHLLERKPLPERTLFWGHGPWRAARRGRWKLTIPPKEAPFLADLDADPGEKNDLAGSNSKMANDLRAAIDGWEKETAKPVR